MPKKKAVKFDEALKTLEESVKKLEAEDLDLETFVDIFTEGLKSAAICQKKLNESKRRIDIVMKEFSDTSKELQPFDESELTDEE